MRRFLAVWALACALPFTARAAPYTPQHLTRAESLLRNEVYRSHPYLAQIIDREDPEWSPLRSYGGWGDTNASYGLCQADPGYKMDGHPGWMTNPWVQLRWCVSYADGSYGSEQAAWVFWQGHSWW